MNEEDKGLNNLTQFIAYIAVLALAVGTSVLVMTRGWGLEPKSWWWILGVGIFVHAVLLRLMDKIRSGE